VGGAAPAHRTSRNRIKLLAQARRSTGPSARTGPSTLMKPTS